MKTLEWVEDSRQLICEGQVFDPARLEWSAAQGSSPSSVAVSPTDALLRFAERGSLRRVPIGIIGPREATPGQCEFAEKMGAALATHGLQLLCGGKNGVMEAACRGHASLGGLPIGILPDDEWQAANPYVGVPIATGIGPARNAIIARACLALVAIGGGVGTLSEMALGLQFNRLVLATSDAPRVEGVPIVGTLDEILGQIAMRILKIV
ncbi:TIGR00725 family protein [Sinorhizobium fredii]|uniref:TIGR00725 family protein n=1 Tax=Rhizobium fredii TaxID=380 RepID=UPI0005633AC3|nr:TIGR00725 family protein [Sinorhizobium fredii]